MLSQKTLNCYIYSVLAVKLKMAAGVSHTKALLGFKKPNVTRVDQL